RTAALEGPHCDHYRQRHFFARPERAISASKPGRIPLKNAFSTILASAPSVLTFGLSVRPSTSALVATCSRGRFWRTLATPLTTCSYSFLKGDLSLSCSLQIG